MAGSVYKMFCARWTEAWYQLSKAERDAIFGKIEEKMKQLGGKATLVCDSSWNSEQWLFWGVEEYPNIEAVQEYANTLSELNWFRYCDAEILLGTAMQEWVMGIRDRCLRVKVPFFFKQWGGVQKKRAGRTWDEMPVNLVRA